MPASSIQSLITQARALLHAKNIDVPDPDTYWDDAELLYFANRAIDDLQRRLKDQQEDYFAVEDDTLQLVAGEYELSEVPNDVMTIHSIQPADLAAYPGIMFKPKRYTHLDFIQARADSAVDPATGGIIWYHAMGPGGPLDPPRIKIAPRINTTINVLMVYTPVESSRLATAENPIPGSSDHAIVAWIVAYALAKDREDREPDSEWLAIYATEKANLITALTPRQDDEPKIAEGVFEGLWD